MFLFNLKLMHDLLQFKMTKALTNKLLSSVVVTMKLCFLIFVNTLEKMSMHLCLTFNVYIYAHKGRVLGNHIEWNLWKTDVVTSTTSLHIPEDDWWYLLQRRLNVLVAFNLTHKSNQIIYQMNDISFIQIYT